METLDKHFRHLTQAAFKTHGFATADLLSHWPDIVGERLAGLATPDRIKWPKDKSAGATLHLRCQPGRTLDVQYAAPQIMERINQYLGYAAIAKMKLATGRSKQVTKAETGSIEQLPKELLSPIDTISDPELKAALARLAQGIAADKSRSPQAK